MPLTLTRRMDLVEQKVAALEGLPDRMSALESQFLQLRDEMRVEFSACRKETREGDEKICRSLGDEIRVGDEETRRVLRDEIRAGDEETRRVLRDDIRAGDEETRKLMRILHEDSIARIATMQEGRNGRRPRKR